MRTARAVNSARPTFPVSVELMDGRKIEIRVEPKDPIGTIVRYIKNGAALPPLDDYSLSTNDNQILAEDSSVPPDTAEQLNIREGTKLYFWYQPETFQLNIRRLDNNSVMHLLVAPTHTLRQIMTFLEPITGYAVAQQRLHFRGHELPNIDGRLRTMYFIGVLDANVSLSFETTET